MIEQDRKKRLEDRARKTRAQAHERVIKDATIQFRLDADNMERILTLADERRTGVGVLARMWVLERLNQELGESKAGQTPDLVAAALLQVVTLMQEQLRERGQLLELADLQAKALNELRKAFADQQKKLESVERVVSEKLA